MYYGSGTAHSSGR